MKTIGLLGGMSWESTAHYYRLMNEAVRERRGGLHSARLLLYSVDFAEVELLQREGRWDEAGALLADVARRLELGGAELLVLCTNTMHRVAAAIQAAVSIPLLHIAEPTAELMRRDGLRSVGLLGTRFTMEQDFYVKKIQEAGFEVLVPEAAERELVHRVIYDELCLGEIRGESRAQYAAVMRRLVERGAQGIILGCTEIGLLVGEEDSPVPLYDTTAIHAVAAVEHALGARR